VNISEMKQNIELAFAANQPTMIWGSPGCGKSQGVEQVAKELNMKFIDVRLSQMDAVDLRGIPFRDKETNRTDWAVPNIWPTDDVPTVIMFDEINHGTQSTLSAAFQAIQERRIGDFHFPPSVRFLAAGNRAKDRTFANQMPSALRNRFSHITVESSEDDFCKYANSSGFAQLVTGFIRFSPVSLDEFTEHNKSTEEQKRVSAVKKNNAFATPRSWEAVSKLINCVTTIDKNGTELVDLNRAKKMVIGTIGESEASKFFGYANFYKDLPDLNKLIKNPMNYDVPTAPEMQYAICAGLANKATTGNFANVIKYILRLPAEFQAMAVNDALARDVLLSTTPAFATWASNNTDVIF